MEACILLLDKYPNRWQRRGATHSGCRVGTKIKEYFAQLLNYVYLVANMEFEIQILNAIGSQIYHILYDTYILRRCYASETSFNSIILWKLIAIYWNFPSYILRSHKFVLFIMYLHKSIM